MKETIKYFYDVYPNEIYEIENGCYFYYSDYKFYFVKFKRNIQEIDMLVKISNDLYNKNILVDTFILSKDNKFYVLVDEDVYVMIRVNSLEDDVFSLKELVKFDNSIISDKRLSDSSNWGTLWMKKVDDFEMQMSEINLEYPLLQSSFNYYVGLAENAISYFLDTVNEEDMSTVKINLNHKRINSKAYSGLIYNPLTFTFDYEVRDIAEYIKIKFFDGVLDYEEVDDIIISGNLSKASLRVLFSRLLYPSYYFDYVKNIFIYDVSEEGLRKYISKIRAYEIFLLDVFNLINRKYSLPPLEWLFNKG